jgi:hypothetical protein
MSRLLLFQRGELNLHVLCDSAPLREA